MKTCGGLSPRFRVHRLGLRRPLHETRNLRVNNQQHQIKQTAQVDPTWPNLRSRHSSLNPVHHNSSTAASRPSVTAAKRVLNAKFCWPPGVLRDGSSLGMPQLTLLTFESQRIRATLPYHSQLRPPAAQNTPRIRGITPRSRSLDEHDTASARVSIMPGPPSDLFRDVGTPPRLSCRAGLDFITGTLRMRRMGAQSSIGRSPFRTASNFSTRFFSRGSIESAILRRNTNNRETLNC